MKISEVTRAQVSKIVVVEPAPEMSAMMSRHLCRLLSIHRRNVDNFAHEQTTFKEIRGEHKSPFLDNNGEVRELDGESVSNTESVIA